MEFKWLLLFFLAAISLLLSGSVAANNLQLEVIIVLILGGFCGIFLIYNKSVLNPSTNIVIQLWQFFFSKRHVFFTILLIVLIPFAFKYLSGFSFILFALSGTLGVLYLVTININHRKFRLKNLFLIKNLLIGASWGVLILIGAGSPKNEFIMCLWLFITIQIFLGSMIRDLSDIREDMIIGVKSFPVVFGNDRTIVYMHIINIASLSVLFLSNWSLELSILILVVFLWRSLILFKVKNNTKSILWGQTLNLSTSYLIFFIILIQNLL